MATARGVDAHAVLGQMRDSEAPDDLLDLADYSYQSILQAVWARHMERMPYTWIGPVLVSVNPCCDLRSFSAETVQRHLQESGMPHPFTVVDRALQARGPAAILVTGESGAGKTEAVKAMLSFLVARQGASSARVCDALVRSTPALEAFGNARTLQNSNSSRFGKLAEVALDERTGQVRGAAVVPYMLEASRITHHAHGEMNFHIFYVLCRAFENTSEKSFWGQPSLWEAWSSLAGKVSDLRRSPYLFEEGEADASPALTFNEIVGSMQAVGVQDAEILGAMQVVLAVALLGNVSPVDIYAETVPADAGAGAESGKDLQVVSELLGMPLAELQAFLSTRTTERGDERICQPRTPREALVLRDSIARELYTALFSWLVRQVAVAAAPDVPEPAATPQRRSSSASSPRSGLAILDIYGFEVCHRNGLEQMLINYCNERLQSLFNAQMFAAEALEYEAEGLPARLWEHLCHSRKLPALPLLEGGEGVRSPGLFALVDDEARCRFNDGCDTALRSKMDISLSAYSAYKPSRIASCFKVSHFAGEVQYDSRGFVQANANAAKPEILSFFCTTASPFLGGLLQGDASPSRSPSRSPCGSPARSPDRPRQLFGRTVIQAFRSELDQLVQSFEAEGTECHYVRCIKPNAALQPVEFDAGFVLRQCLYSGLLETVQIRQYGYPHRRSVSAFVMRYAAVAWPRQGLTDERAAAEEILTSLREGGLTEAEAFLGSTKVLLRPSGLELLEDLLLKARCAAERLQSVVLGCRQRRRFLRLRRAAITLQLALRIMLARRATKRSQVAVMIQALWRGWLARRLAEAQRQLLAAWLSAAVDIQRCFRGHLARRRALPVLPEWPIPCQAEGRASHETSASAGVKTRERSASRVLQVWARSPEAKENEPPCFQDKAKMEADAREAQAAKRKALMQEKEREKFEAQMQAVQDQFDALRAIRVSLLREVAGARRAGVEVSRSAAHSPRSHVSLHEQGARRSCRSSSTSGHVTPAFSSRWRAPSVQTPGPPSPQPLGSPSRSELWERGRAPQEFRERWQKLAPSPRPGIAIRVQSPSALSPCRTPKSQPPVTSPSRGTAGSAPSQPKRRVEIQEPPKHRREDILQELLSRCGKLSEQSRVLQDRRTPRTSPSLRSLAPSSPIRATSKGPMSPSRPRQLAFSQRRLSP